MCSGKMERGRLFVSATVKVGDFGTVTDFDGQYNLSVVAGEVTVEYSYVGYQTQRIPVSIAADENKTLDVALDEGATILQTATVTSGKFDKPLGEVTVSLEVLKPDLLESTNTTTVESVLDKVPGVNMIDGQANIRGGSGFSYRAATE